METERLILRPWLETDAEALYKYASDPDVGPRAGRPPHKSVEESREIIKGIFSGEGMWAVELKATHEPIGCAGYLPASGSNLQIADDEAEVGYWVAKSYWNQGICTEALRAVIDYCFRVKGFKALWGTHFTDNPASGRVMEKCGFADTGQRQTCPGLLVGSEKEVRVLMMSRVGWERTMHQNEDVFNRLLARIDEKLAKGTVVVAIDGRCASGKSTLASRLADVYDCTVFHMDDFFLQPAQRTAQRLATPGENVDHERFRNEVMIPLSEGKTVQYRKYNCHTRTIEPPIEIQQKKLTVVEGAYCLHRDISEFYDLKIALDVGPDVQRERIAKRNSPATAERFFSEWIPLEEQYFNAFSIYENVDMVLTID